jgi:hypothetical protein
MNDRLADAVSVDCHHQRCQEPEVTAEERESPKIAVLEPKVSDVEPIRS